MYICLTQQRQKKNNIWKNNQKGLLIGEKWEKNYTPCSVSLSQHYKELRLSSSRLLFAKLEISGYTYIVIIAWEY